jgi:hypothetical protein
MAARYFITNLFLITFLLLVSDVQAQRNRSYALIYKYKEGDTYRVSTSTYQNFSTTSKAYSHSTYGETAFDLYEEITGSDHEAYDMTVRIELTKQTVNGQNLTYKLSNLFKDDIIKFTFDRFGKILDSTVQYENISNKKETIQKRLASVRNIFLPFPNHLIKVGDSWKIEDYFDRKQIDQMFTSPYGMTQPEVRGVYSLDSVDQGTAKIGLALDILGGGKLAASGDSMQVDFAAQITGTFYFNIIEGKIANGNLITQITGLGKLSNEDVEFTGSEVTSFTSEKYK